MERQDKIKEITDRLEEGIKDLFASDRYKQYLQVMSRFTNYSLNNQMLIAMQRPDATYVAGYRSWEKNFDRHVKKGQKGIRILAPSPYQTTKLVDAVDPATNQPLTDENGEVIKESVQLTVPAYKVVTVFDVSQTEGKELPTIADDLKNSVKDYGCFMEALRQISPVPIQFEPMSGRIHGYYHLDDKMIFIREDMSQQQTIKTCIHEIAHSILHYRDPVTDTDRRTREVQAESVAYTVCCHYGLDTSDYSFGYIASWSSDKGLDELRGSINTIRITASELIERLDKKLIKAEGKAESLVSKITTLETIKADVETKRVMKHRHRSR